MSRQLRTCRSAASQLELHCRIPRSSPTPITYKTPGLTTRHLTNTAKYHSRPTCTPQHHSPPIPGIMKHFWALPALLRPALVLASQHGFSVHDDILAFPQYEVHFSEEYVSEEQAQSLLKKSRSSDIKAESDVEHYTGRSHPGNREDGAESAEEALEYELMLHHKQRYLCSIPQVEKPEEQQAGENDTVSKAEQEKELARANDRGWELLSGMHGNCIYYMSGWWSYRFCYNQDVKQFHQLPPARGMPVFPPVEDPNSQGYLLGRYDEKKARQQAKKQIEEKWEGEGALEISEHATRKTGGQGELVTRGESRYLVQKLEGGTECDLTGKQRRIEVQVSSSGCTRPNSSMFC